MQAVRAEGGGGWHRAEAMVAGDADDAVEAEDEGDGGAGNGQHRAGATQPLRQLAEDDWRLSRKHGQTFRRVAAAAGARSAAAVVGALACTWHWSANVTSGRERSTPAAPCCGHIETPVAPSHALGSAAAWAALHHPSCPHSSSQSPGRQGCCADCMTSISTMKTVASTPAMAVYRSAWSVRKQQRSKQTSEQAATTTCQVRPALQGTPMSRRAGESRSPSSTRYATPLPKAFTMTNTSTRLANLAARPERGY